MLISFLMGHSLQGVSARYTNELMIANSQALREVQEKISRRIFELLGLTLGGHHDAPLVPDTSTGKNRRAAAPARIRNNQTEEARTRARSAMGPHEHDAAAWAKHREAQRQPYRQPD